MYTQSHSVIKQKAHSPGVTTMLVIAFMGVFLLLLSTLMSFIFEQAKFGRMLYAREQSVHVAESGLEYYKWYLAHHPSVLASGAGLVSPYAYTVNDPEGGAIGTATITATANLQCGVVQWIDITSRGVASEDPTYPRILNARYMHPSINSYSAVYNSNIWYGPGDSAVGPVHSNGGVRMDGTNNADVTSQVSTWTCNSSFGCSTTNSNAPGVFGNGTGSALWRYPVSPVNFSVMLPTFASLQAYAQASGLLLTGTSVKLAGVTKATFADVSGADTKGFHLVFNANGSVTVYRVTNTIAATSAHVDAPAVWVTDNDIISAESLVGTYTVPVSCGVIFAQAKTWIEGTVSGKVTLIAADTGAYNPDLIIRNNISYATSDGTTGFTAIAERNVILPLDAPDTLTVRGTLVAKNGYFGRNYFITALVPNAYKTYILRTRLVTIGTTVSTAQSVTTWVSGNTVTSGYQTTQSSYDRILAFQPPGFTPIASTDYYLSLWREQ